MPQSQFPVIRNVLLILGSTVVVSFLAISLFGSTVSKLVEIGATIVALGTIVYTDAWYVTQEPKEPVQELEILVDLPAGTEVNVVPLLLNPVDSFLFSYLWGKCTRTVDHGKILLHYKRHGKIYNPEQNTFQIKGAFYRPTALKVIYCRA
jgi:hypothetical protein